MFNLNAKEEYKNFRWFFTSEGKLVIGGKSDEQNEIAIRNFLKPDYVIMHTSAPGSSFMIIQSEKSSKKDMDETAIFTGCFSKQWKKGNQKIDIDIFKGSQIYKDKSMKTGTFGVQGIKKTIKIKPELVIVIQKGRLRAVPKTTIEKKLAEIKPGKLSKEEAGERVGKILRNKFHLLVHKEEIMSAIPSDKLDVK